MSSQLGPSLNTGAAAHSGNSTPKSSTLDHPLAIHDPLSNPFVALPSTTAHVAEDEDEEPFRYPGAEDGNSSEPNSPVFKYEPSIPIDSPPVSTEPELHLSSTVTPLEVSAPSSVPPSPPPPAVATPSVSAAQLETLVATAASGDLETLQLLFRSIITDTGVQPFALANDASPRTGQTALHAASSRGHLPVVQWLIDNCGAMADLEDKEGETAVHKAAVNGRLDIVKFLLSLAVGKADVHAQDADGWTALHNACSKGYLDIVRWLCEKGGAAEAVPGSGVRGIDQKSKGGWTPLMNAASKGHLPIVLYLLNKQGADPLVRNNWGETAYDAAAAVFEVWICEVLQRAEADKWRTSTSKYDPLAVHTTVPIILHENQRLDARLKTLAVNGGRPKFSASGLGRRGRRSPFELRLPEDGKIVDVPAWRSDVQLPFLEDPFVLPKPRTERSGPSREGAERSHFWLSDWTLDLTHPKVDFDEGWQYAQTLNDPDDQWTAEVPPQLERLLLGSSLLTPTGSSSSARGSSTPSSATWARRRRWIRVLRRRLDIPPLPFLQPDGMTYHLTDDGTLVPVVGEPGSLPNIGSDGEGQELGSMTSHLSTNKDYVARARYLAGTQRSLSSDSFAPGVSRANPADVKRTINKLERAVNELRTGMLSDSDAERRTQAEVLLNAYSRELERTRLSARAEGLLTFNTTIEEEEEDADDSDESFHYPSQSPPPSVRAMSIRSQATDYFNQPPRPSSSRVPTDLTPQLSQAPEFRVPTHEAPQKVRTPRWTPPTPHQMHAQWERDEQVSECRSCKRRFTFYFRKHHCRRCGRIFCDRCSSHRVVLDPSDVVLDPGYPEAPNSRGMYSHRVCDSCHDEVSASVPTPLRTTRPGTMEGIMINQSSLAVPGHSREASSQISDLADCPVCGQNLADLGPITAQESHVKSCLDGGSPSSAGIGQVGKYIVYKLPSESTLIGDECVICLEEFLKDSLVARMSCLCTFHNSCLSSWLQRGRSCPVHARDT